LHGGGWGGYYVQPSERYLGGCSGCKDRILDFEVVEFFVEQIDAKELSFDFGFQSD
jgi:hypothetical protein